MASYTRHISAICQPPRGPDIAYRRYRDFRDFNYQQREVSKFFDEELKHDGLRNTNEGNINASLVNVSSLVAICMWHPNVQATWTPQRASLVAKFRNPTVESEQQRVFLVSQGDEELCPDGRSDYQDPDFLLRMKGLATRRTLFRPSTGTDEDSNRGPWRMNKYKHVEEFASLILAVVLSAEEVSAQDR
ncbi:uncharacterized protein N7515_006217 [Penicillium bovifimosum]|uniref:Uncharacterized protein n=1 Tax=Penicillium bovifimosum TaxID=126998 RepID=A0A9W9GUM6_9EURO|nr:uncharacterized protein N7515_006217 [Penicillium bovifimosum]KAJ5130178.1 hypothetical protein N7515_006217 [Penicillium bovifimosum]